MFKWLLRIVEGIAYFWLLTAVAFFANQLWFLAADEANKTACPAAMHVYKTFPVAKKWALNRKLALL